MTNIETHLKRKNDFDFDSYDENKVDGLYESIIKDLMVSIKLNWEKTIKEEIQISSLHSLVLPKFELWYMFDSENIEIEIGDDVYFEWKKCTMENISELKYLTEQFILTGNINIFEL